MLSSVTTPQDLDERFRAELAGLVTTTVIRAVDEPVRDDTALTGAQARALYDAQSTSRHLDLAARWLRSFDAGYYTIGSSGHEGNAAVAAALRPTDPALLHYRSGGFYCMRAGQVAGSDPIRDVLRGVMASAREPIAGGRHKVFGHADLHVIPTTSTIASHLPRAVGIAYALGRGRRLNPPANGHGWPADAVVVCSFGDASINHAAATAAFNTAGWCDHVGIKLPLLFVCEDNGLGISVRSPEGWVTAALQSRPGLRYYAADGTDSAATYDKTAEAAAWVRRYRRPAVLHLTTIRLMGHAGADAEMAYRTPVEIAADLARDPLVRTARLLVDAGVATPAELMARYDELGWDVRRVAEEVLGEPRLANASEVTAPLAPRRPVRVSRAVSDAATALMDDEDGDVAAIGDDLEFTRAGGPAPRMTAGQPLWAPSGAVSASSPASAAAAEPVAGRHSASPSDPAADVPPTVQSAAGGHASAGGLGAQPSAGGPGVHGAPTSAPPAAGSSNSALTSTSSAAAALPAHGSAASGPPAADGSAASGPPVAQGSAAPAEALPHFSDVSDSSASTSTSASTSASASAQDEDEEWPDPEPVSPAGAARPDRDAPEPARDSRLNGNGQPPTRAAAFNGRLPERAGPLTLAQTINATLTDAMLAYPQMVVFGEDVAAKGGVYGVTKGLRDRFGATRVFDTLLDETSILGLGLGAGISGLLPVPEIQYLAYLHNAEDQLRGEAATMQFFSQGAFHNPMVVRVAGLAYQQGFGGHFHNDNALAVLRDIPGLVVAAPSRAEDAAPMLRTCLASAVVDGSVCVFLEPIALYHTRDLHTESDTWWLSDYAPPSEWSAIHVPIGRARTYGSGPNDDLTIITFGNGVRLSLRAAARLAGEGIACRVVDLRWLSPLPVGDIIKQSSDTGRVLVVDETRRSGGVGEGVIAALVDAGYVGVARRVAAVDSFVPLGPAANHVLVSEEQIVQGARSLLAR
ncbi:thiamine pyrophosphate-dependent enzyme [Dactylosporangium sp. NPDC005572]|uniref:thiamine pyrophosphate-dependent enzyme n=1 Tax=Dactylosporangium sp. NPDC005572 TaxID=3156889 RepID=UPI0033BBD225